MSARAWIIGGKQGIGSAIGTELEEHHIEVHATDETDADVTSTRQLMNAMADIQPHFVVYCAGINKLMAMEDFDDFDALNILDINALGFMRVMSLVANMGLQPHSVVAIVSDAATRPMRNSMAYCASKAALAMAVRCAAREFAVKGVRVNGISPGVVEDTAMSAEVDSKVMEIKGWTAEEIVRHEKAAIPMGRRAYKSEIARVCYSVLTGPAYLTGAIIEVNGAR